MKKESLPFFHLVITLMTSLSYNIQSFPYIYFHATQHSKKQSHSMHTIHSQRYFGSSTFPYKKRFHTLSWSFMFHSWFSPHQVSLYWLDLTPNYYFCISNHSELSLSILLSIDWIVAYYHLLYSILKFLMCHW